MEEAGARDCCGMGQAGNFRVVALSLLEHVEFQNNWEYIGCSDKLDLLTC